MAKQGPKVVSRSHPRGSNGTKVSVSEIVRKVEQGRLDPRTRAWSVETLHRGNLGGFGADKMAQAKAIFDRLKKERVYVEDPVDGEFMQSSACTLDGCEGLTFLGGDCDDLVIAFLSAIESVGIEGALVAHSYDSTKQHTHVLCAVRDDKRKRWVRCDPSANDPFGTVSRPTRETFYGIPGGKVLADASGLVDATRVGSALGNVRPTGDFVGVGRPFGFGQTETDSQAEPALEGFTEAFEAYMRQETARIVQDVEQSWYELQFQHEQMVLATQMMNDLTGDNYTYVEPDVATPGTQPVTVRWTAEDEARYQAMEAWAPVMIRYGKEAADGRRDLYWDEGGAYGKQNGLGYEKSSIVISGRQGEPYVGLHSKTAHFIVKTSPSSGSVGNPYVIAGVVIVCAVAGYFVFQELADVAKTAVVAKRQQQKEKFMAEQSARYGPDKAKEMLDAITESSKAEAAARVEEKNASPFAKFTSTASSALDAVVILGVAAAAVYGITVAVDLFKSRKTARA